MYSIYLYLFNLVSPDCSSSADTDFRMCWQPEHRSRILEVICPFFVTKVLSMTRGNHVVKLVTPYGVVHHSEREPQSCCQHPWPVSAEAVRTVPGCSPVEGRKQRRVEILVPQWVNSMHAVN